MGGLDWFVGILLFIICLGVLVTIHELGHFIAAKAFNVYCMEFSIGFGPAIFSRKPKNKETKFSLRAFPLGGYVSMFGEEVEEAGLADIPHERGLEAQKKWKRAIIYVAGITMNFLLGFTILCISATCFKVTTVNYGWYDVSTSGNITTAIGGFVMKSQDPSYLIKNNDILVVGLYEESESQVLVIDDNVDINGDKYVICVNPLYTYKKDPNLVEAITIYEQSEFKFDTTIYDRDENGEIILDEDNNPKTILSRSYYLPSNVVHNPLAGEEVHFNMTVNRDHNFEILNISLNAVGDSKDNYFYNDIGVYFPRLKYWRGFADGMKYAWDDFAYANTAIVKALGQLVIGKGWNQMGGAVAIAQQITLVQANYGFSMYLRYAGYISCNLALFNLIPFPGLDGWSLLVLAIEAITRKKMPQKVKAIVSVVGLVLLFGLMIAVFVKDIIGLF